jgi:hypothetical protein
VQYIQRCGWSPSTGKKDPGWNPPPEVVAPRMSEHDSACVCVCANPTFMQQGGKLSCKLIECFQLLHLSLGPLLRKQTSTVVSAYEPALARVVSSVFNHPTR